MMLRSVSRAPRPRASRLVALFAVLAVAIALAGCRSITSAIEVGDESISIDDFEAELAAITDNAAFAEALPTWVADGRPSRAGAAGWATFRIRQLVVDAEFAERELKLEDGAAAAAKDAITQQLGPEAVEALPAFFFEYLAREQALRATLPAAVPAVPTDAEIEALYAQTFACDSGIEVAHILVATRAEADDIVAALAAGGDFAALAAERSTDTGSAAQGGALGCFIAGQFVAEFEAGVLGATEGVPTDPVESEFGFHIILTNAYAAPPLESVRDQLIAQLQAGQTVDDPIEAFLQRRLTEISIRVDPRYGTFSAETGAVTEPGAPVVSDERPPSLSG